MPDQQRQGVAPSTVPMFLDPRVAANNTRSPARRPQRRRNTAGITTYGRVVRVTMPVGSRRAITTPGVAVSVSRSPGSQFKARMTVRSATRPGSVEATHPVHHTHWRRRGSRRDEQRQRRGATRPARNRHPRAGGGRRRDHRRDHLAGHSRPLESGTAEQPPASLPPGASGFKCQELWGNLTCCGVRGPS
jgi:hypothetical protein